MKNNLLTKILPLILVIFIWSCEDDEEFGFFTSPTNTSTEVDDITSPGGMLSIAANFTADTILTLGDTLSVTANLSDDTGLSRVDINIIDAEPALLLDTTINISGEASIITFDYIIPYVANSGSLGELIIEANIIDESGNSFMQEALSINVVQPEFEQMFVLVQDSAISMTKAVDNPNAWELTTSLENMQEFLFSVTQDSMNYVWGDTTEMQDGVADFGQVGIVNVEATGDVLISFNDATFEYSIAPLIFDEIFLLGNFNGWGNGRPEDAMTKTGDHDWIITTEFTSPDGVDPVAPEDVTFKFVTGPDFDGNKDWGQDPTREPSVTGGIAVDSLDEQNINPGFTTVPVTITFNDITGVYTISTIASNYSDIFIVGNFTGWGGNDGALSVQMELIDDNLWEAEIDPDNFDGGFDVSNNIEFKFSVQPTLGTGILDFGDDEQDFLAEDTGGEANINPGISGGNYLVQFNDNTLEYNIGTVRNIDMFIIGNFSGWGGANSDLSPEMRVIDENTWGVTVDPVNFVSGFADPYIFKIVNEPDFVNQTAWGPTGDVTALTGTGNPDGGAPNFEPGFTTGTFDVTFNDLTLEYVISN